MGGRDGGRGRSGVWVDVRDGGRGTDGIRKSEEGREGGRKFRKKRDTRACVCECVSV